MTQTIEAVRSNIESKPKRGLPSAAFSDFPLNQWYVAAGRQEIAEAPLGRRLLGKNIVIFRKSNGEVAALDDRCAHKGYPLSVGCVKGDAIQCGYHGLEFDGEGRCIKIPNQKASPAALKVRSYPVIEKWQWVYIWLGDPNLADPALLPAVDMTDYPKHNSLFVDPFFYKGNYMLAIENVLDAAHVNFIHGGIGGSEEIDFVDIAQISSDSKSVTVKYEEENLILPDMMYAAFHLPVPPGTPVNRRITFTAEPPSVINNWHDYYLATEDFDWNNPGPMLRQSISAIALVPADDRHGYHFVSRCADFPLTVESNQFFGTIIKQDLDAFALLQDALEAEPDFREVIIPSDKPGMLVRRLIDKMVAQEQL